MFDWEPGIALHTMQDNQASSRGEREASCVFLNRGRNQGHVVKFRQGWPFETRVCSAKSGLLSSYDGQLRSLK